MNTPTYSIDEDRPVIHRSVGLSEHWLGKCDTCANGKGGIDTYVPMTRESAREVLSLTMQDGIDVPTETATMRAIEVTRGELYVALCMTCFNKVRGMDPKTLAEKGQWRTQATETALKTDSREPEQRPNAMPLLEHAHA